MAGNSVSDTKQKPQNYDYFLVLDFEATCDNNQKIIPQVRSVTMLVNQRNY